jgi:TetR/AcrR family transcriptional regulator, repressor for uid operon
MPKQTPNQHQARRADILAHSVECFARKGFHQTSMRDLSVTLGISLGGLYTYFKSKDEIISAFIERDRAQTKELFASVPPGMSFLESMGALNEIADSMSHGPGSKVGRSVWMQIGAEASINPKVRALMARHYEFVTSQLEALILAAQQTGEISPTADARALAVFILSTFDGLVMRQVVQPRFERAAQVAFVQEILAQFAPNTTKGGKRKS